MSVGPSLGLVSSVAATPLAQAKGSDLEKQKTDAAQKQRQDDSVEKAEAAAGIGKTEEESATSDRDADGRRPWEIGPPEHQSAGEAPAESNAPPRSKDPTGQCGQSLDLSG